MGLVVKSKTGGRGGKWWWWWVCVFVRSSMAPFLTIVTLNRLLFLIVDRFLTNRTNVDGTWGAWIRFYAGS